MSNSPPERQDHQPRDHRADRHASSIRRQNEPEPASKSSGLSDCVLTSGGRPFIMPPSGVKVPDRSDTVAFAGDRGDGAGRRLRRRESRIAFGSCAHQGMVTRDFPGHLEALGAGEVPISSCFSATTSMPTPTTPTLKWQKYQQLAALPGFKALQKTCPILATWDDHDYGLNDSGAEFREKVSSQKLFIDFFEVPAKTRRAAAGRACITRKCFGPPGRRMQVILLDTRYFRGPLLRNHQGTDARQIHCESTDRSATLLGPAQWAWLSDQLSRPAELRLLISSIQVLAQDHGWERWMTLPHERAKLFNLIRSTGRGGRAHPERRPACGRAVPA
jgi:hypothetical protein